MRTTIAAIAAFALISSACGRYSDSSIRSTIVGVDIDTEAHSDVSYWQGGQSDLFTVEAPSLQLQLHQPALALSVVVDGAELVAVQDGRTVRGLDLKGFTLAMRDAKGALAFAHIDGVERDTSDPSEQTYLYSLNYVGPDGTTTPACTPDANGSTKATPLRGRWDASGAKVDVPTAMTMACSSSVQARCVNLGYRPWQSLAANEHVGPTSLDASHQACVRALHNDVCGDGQDRSGGGPVTLTDRIVNQPDTCRDHCAPTTPKVFQTVWAASGAFCVSREHWLSIYSGLPTSCTSQFPLFAQPSPVNPADFCIAQRLGLTADEGLISSAR